MKSLSLLAGRTVQFHIYSNNMHGESTILKRVHQLLKACIDFVFLQLVWYHGGGWGGEGNLLLIGEFKELTRIQVIILLNKRYLP